MYEGCPESIQPFWISREPVAWPWCNLTASQRRPYCASVNSHCPVGLVSRQWDTVDWAFVLWPSHSQWPSEHTSFITTMRLPVLQLSCRLFWQSITSHRSVSPQQPRFGSLRLLALPKAKNAVEREEICECDGHTVHELSQRRLTAVRLAPRESNFTDAREGLLWLAAKLHQVHATGSRDIQNGWIFSEQPSYTYTCISLYVPSSEMNTIRLAPNPPVRNYCFSRGVCDMQQALPVAFSSSTTLKMDAITTASHLRRPQSPSICW